MTAAGSQAVGDGVQRFVQRQFGTAGEPDRRQPAPRLFTDRAGDVDALGTERVEMKARSFAASWP
ncbi:hypothetical protein [Streptomyces justiciae]|uniref:Uncharacterized protein n=1 Tax=Streptomyces justiciae TaxID=2780140 RepID=A0ABU3M285_9ACTN|nr:hypothetical protein [Streptomyces justiciae]MDT7845616.1 hypothetical protein [Streptomyces justiciae]